MYKYRVFSLCLSLVDLLLSLFVLLILKFKMTVQSSPIDIAKVPTDSDPLAAAMLESQPRQTVPWPAWLTDKYEECTAPDAEDDLPDEDDGIFVIEDL